MNTNKMSLRWKERVKTLVAAAVLTALGLTAISALSATESSAHETAIVDVIQRQAEAWNRGDLEVHPLGDTSAWMLGRWDLAAPDTESGGIFTLVMQRLDGNWVVVHDHTSSEPGD